MYKIPEKYNTSDFIDLTTAWKDFGGWHIGVQPCCRFYGSGYQWQGYCQFRL